MQNISFGTQVLFKSPLLKPGTAKEFMKGAQTKELQAFNAFKTELENDEYGDDAKIEYTVTKRRFKSPVRPAVIGYRDKMSTTFEVTGTYTKKGSSIKTNARSEKGYFSAEDLKAVYLTAKRWFDQKKAAGENPPQVDQAEIQAQKDKARQAKEEKQSLIKDLLK